MNLRSIPGTTYPIGQRFTLLPMPEDSPYKPSWWYRKEFVVPEALAGRSLWLHFDGINYRANVWVNGTQIANEQGSRGRLPPLRVRRDGRLRAGRRRAVAVEVFAPEPTDLAFMWVDWNPTPADKNMGLWADVYLADSGPLALRQPHVVAELDLPSLETRAPHRHRRGLEHHRPPADGRAARRHRGVQFSKAVSLGPRERTTVRFTPAGRARPRGRRTRGSGGRTAGARRSSTRSPSTSRSAARSPTARRSASASSR